MSTFAMEPRPPLSVVYDAELVRHLRREAFRATLGWRALALRTVLVGAVALWLALGWDSLAGAVLIALGLGVLPVAVAYLRTRSALRSAVGPGLTVVSGYDDQGRFVIERPAGRLHLPAGHARRVVDRDGVVAIVPRNPRHRTVVAAAPLLTSQDRDHLTRPTARAGTTLPYTLTITPQIRRALGLELFRQLTRPYPGVPLALLIGLEVCLFATMPPPQGLHYLIALLALLALLALALWAGQRVIYPNGVEVGAGLDADGLHLAIYRYPPVIPLARISAVWVTPRAVVIRRGAVRRLLLPRDLLPAAQLDVLQAHVTSRR